MASGNISSTTAERNKTFKTAVEFWSVFLPPLTFLFDLRVLRAAYLANLSSHPICPSFLSTKPNTCGIALSDSTVLAK